jgi:putative lipoprotein
VASLVGTTWVAEDIDERGVIERVQSTLTFGSPQRISGRAACNQYFGSLEQQEGTVRFRPAGATRMACAPAVMDQEQRFLSALGAVTTVRFDAGKLLLIDERGRVRVRLAPFPPGSGASVPMPFQAHAFDCGGGLCAP